MKKDVIEFVRTKDYKFIKYIGQGGTGKTVLLEDETINESFVCKKYSPFYPEHKETYFNNFVDEIRLLHLLYHRNVVRVFNYYLYPERTTGYILMEYIDGVTINQYIKNNPDKISSIFVQTIDGFRHLEENGILHRDIRPENILVSVDGLVKIIDFGFGKRIHFAESFDNSVSLNWRYTIPKDFEFKIYDFVTEIYFVGKLFEEIVDENNLANFQYSSLLVEMTAPLHDSRISSFFDLERRIIETGSNTFEFEESEINVYQRFANELSTLFSKIEINAEYIRDVDIIIMSLEDVYRNSLLEYVIQNPSTIARCFVKGQYYYMTSAVLSVFHLKHFLSLLKSTDTSKQKIILNNLWQRLDKVEKYSNRAPDDDDLPF